MLGNRVNDLEQRLATQGKLLAERDFENNQLRQASEAAERIARELRDEISRTEQRQGAGAGKAADGEGRGRGAASPRARRTRQAAARHQRDPAAGRKLLGDRAHGKRAVARTHQRHRRRGGQTRDAARRSEFADRGHAGGGRSGVPAKAAKPVNGTSANGAAAGGAVRGRRHARRAHPGAAVPRLPRPPAAAGLTTHPMT